MSTAVARDVMLPATRRRVGKRVGLATIGLAVLAGAAWFGLDWWNTGRFVETTDDAYVGGNVTSLAAHVPGFIQSVLVRDNQRVNAGQLLVQLDPRDYDAALQRARATVAAKRATLDSLRAQLAEQEETVRQQEADLAARSAQAGFAQQEASRYRALAQTAAGSRQDEQRAAALDQQSRSTVLAGAAGLAAAKQHRAVLAANIAEANALVSSAEADLQTAQLNREWTEIRAPIDGFVGNRLAQVGAYAAAGGYLVAVIPAAGLWVDANFKEDQLAHMRQGATAAVTADILPGHNFRAHLASLAPGTGGVFSVIPPENATGNFTKIVQRVPVRLELDDDPALAMLRPGLSTTVRIDTRATNQP